MSNPNLSAFEQSFIKDGEEASIFEKDSFGNYKNRSVAAWKRGWDACQAQDELLSLAQKLCEKSPRFAKEFARLQVKGFVSMQEDQRTEEQKAFEEALKDHELDFDSYKGTYADPHTQAYFEGWHALWRKGEVTVTWDQTKSRILMVTRQDEEHRILSVIAEAPAPMRSKQEEIAYKAMGYLVSISTHPTEMPKEIRDIANKGIKAIHELNEG